MSISHNLSCFLLLLTIAGCKTSGDEITNNDDLTTNQNIVSVKNDKICAKADFAEKIRLLNQNSKGGVTRKVIINSIMKGQFTDDEIFFYLEKLHSLSDGRCHKDLQYIYYYLGGTDPNRILSYYFIEIAKVQVVQSKKTGIAFPNQKVDDYRIHQEMRLLFAAVAGWYNKVDAKEKLDVLSYVDLLAENFNKIFLRSDIKEFKIKDY